MTTPLPGHYSPSIYSQAHSSDFEVPSRTTTTLNCTSPRHNLTPPLESPLGIFDSDFWTSKPDTELCDPRLPPGSHSMPPTPSTSEPRSVRFALPPSRSTANLQLPPPLLPLPPTPSPSTPDLRLEGQHESKTDRFVNRIKNAFGRGPRQSNEASEAVHKQQDESEPSAASASNNPYTYAADQGLQQSRSLASLASVYPVERRYGLVMSDRDSQEEEMSGIVEAAESLRFEEAEQTDASSETYVEEHQVKEARSGPEVDVAQPEDDVDHPESRGKQVREYKDLTEDFHAARAANPIYDGSTISTSAANEMSKDASEPLGKWRCCKCGGGCELYEDHDGEHLVGAVTCVCPHRSCENCALSGRLKPYKPVQEPIPVQLPDDKPKQVQFGVFCGDCGLSWRAQTVKDTVRQKVSAVPKTLVKAGGQPLEKLRHSKSLANLLGEPNTKPPLSKMKSNANLRAKSDEMEKEHGKQVKGVMVYFSGFDCTCGHTLDSSALCFQIVEQEEATAVAPAAVPTEVVHQEPSFTASREDRIRGIGNAVLKIRRGGKTVYHPNPLASNPVSAEDLEWLMSLPQE